MKIDEAIAFLKDCQATHLEWAEIFENDPERERELVMTGLWDDAKEHRKLERQYGDVIALLKGLIVEIDNRPIEPGLLYLKNKHAKER